MLQDFLPFFRDRRSESAYWREADWNYLYPVSGVSQGILCYPHLSNAWGGLYSHTLPCCSLLVLVCMKGLFSEKPLPGLYCSFWFSPQKLKLLLPIPSPRNGWWRICEVLHLNVLVPESCKSSREHREKCFCSSHQWLQIGEGQPRKH